MGKDAYALPDPGAARSRAWRRPHDCP